MSNDSPDARPQNAASPFGPTLKADRRTEELPLAAQALANAANIDPTIPSAILFLSNGESVHLAVRPARQMLATTAPAGGKQ